MFFYIFECCLIIKLNVVKCLVEVIMKINHINIKILKTLSVLFITFLSFNSFSQQLPLSSEYMFNEFLINPAATGNSKFMELRLSSRKQWLGLNDGPTTYNVSIHKLLNNKTMGLGLSVFSDNYGPESRNGFKISYSYILPLKVLKSNLAMGLAFHGFQYTLDYSKLIAYDKGDPTLQTGSQSTFVPDADFGIYLYNKKYTFGISANQLLSMPIDIGNLETSDNSMVRHYYIIGSYLFNLSEKVDFEPSILIKGTLNTPFQADFNFKLIFNKNYFVSVSYRTKNTMVGMIGFNYKNFVFGYAYDYYFSEIQGFQSGSHEIVLGYNFGQNLMSKSLLNSIRTF